MTETSEFLEKFPFLTMISYLKNVYVGIIQNADNSFISMYVLTPNYSEEQKLEFLSCGEDWWYESNRSIPINLFLKHRFQQFKPYLRVFARKECAIMGGPMINLTEISNKRLKRRTITLVKSDDC